MLGENLLNNCFKITSYFLKRMCLFIQEAFIICANKPQVLQRCLNTVSVSKELTFFMGKVGVINYHQKCIFEFRGQTGQFKCETVSGEKKNLEGGSGQASFFLKLLFMTWVLISCKDSDRAVALNSLPWLKKETFKFHKVLMALGSSKQLGS